MRKLYLLSLGLLLFMNSCKNWIKNTEDPVENEVDSIVSITPVIPDQQQIANSNKLVVNKEDILGFWVGYFEKGDQYTYEKDVYADEGLNWQRENKINISIDRFEGDSIIGHSVVAGNNRPFKGTYTTSQNHYIFDVSEPGNDRYDGKFTFQIAKNDSILSGTWKAYKKIDISERKYSLTKKHFQYNPNQMLVNSRFYADWENQKTKKVTYEDESSDYVDFYHEFSTASNIIYEVNASNTKLTKKDVENLKKGDLLIIRNTIYARHGYSFKKRALRVFFDAQPWYIPVHNDIKSEFTELEKQNIELLLKFEKNAKEYYDTFGRG